MRHVCQISSRRPLQSRHTRHGLGVRCIASRTASDASPAKPWLVMCLPNYFPLSTKKGCSASQSTSYIKQNILQPECPPSSSSDRNMPVCGGQFKPAASLLTVTDLEVLAAFLLPVLQETIQGALGGMEYTRFRGCEAKHVCFSTNRRRSVASDRLHRNSRVGVGGSH